jgi:hypothetical protein
VSVWRERYSVGFAIGRGLGFEFGFLNFVYGVSPLVVAAKRTARFRFKYACTYMYVTNFKLSSELGVEIE